MLSALRFRLLLSHVSCEIGVEVLHGLCIHRLLDLVHLLATLVQPQEESMLIAIRSVWGFRLRDGVNRGLASSHVMDNIMDRELRATSFENQIHCHVVGPGSLLPHTLKFVRKDISTGKTLSVSSRLRIGTLVLKGNVVVVQSPVQLARNPSHVHPLHPLMKRSIVAA